MMQPLAIDLFCGLGGWAHGLIAEGWYVVGFDIERHEYDGDKYPGQLVLQDVLTLHGSQFKDAELIVASPPCQAYSYRAMPWKRARELPPPSNELFDACFRIQREACEAAGRHIPMIVENVRGAQKWVGRSRWNFGSYHLWGDVPALMPHAVQAVKHPGLNWVPKDDPRWRPGQAFNAPSRQPKSNDHDGIKQSGTWWHDTKGASRQFSSKSKQRKAWSAKIAKIPQPLSQHIARVFKPEDV